MVWVSTFFEQHYTDFICANISREQHYTDFICANISRGRERFYRCKYFKKGLAVADHGGRSIYNDEVRI